MRRLFYAAGTTALCIGMFVSSASASSLKIMANDGSSLATFDLEAVEALGMHSIKTKTPWTDGVTHFEGAKVKDILAKAGIGGESVMAMAFDDYAVSISPEIIEEYDPIIASRMNGKAMTFEDKGPYWIMFDLDSAEEEAAVELRTYAVWHLVEFEVE